MGGRKIEEWMNGRTNEGSSFLGIGQVGREIGSQAPALLRPFLSL